MKTVLSLLTLFVLLSPFCYSQDSSSKSPYSIEILETLSLEELNTKLSKSLKMRKAGAVLSISAPVSFGSGLWLFVGSWGGDFGGAFTAGLGFIMVLASPVLLVTGLPVLLTGVSRVNRINGVILKKYPDISFHLGMGTQWVYATNSYSPALTLKVNF